MSIKRFKECRTCGKVQPRKWTEADGYQCEECKADIRESLRVIVAPRSMANKSHAARMAHDLRSDPTRRALRNQGDDLDPLNPLSLTSPLNPAYHVNDRNDWDDSSHRNHTSHSSHSSHDDGGSYDSGSSSDSGSSGGSD